MKKLWQVEWRGTAYVMAEDEKEARDEARLAIADYDATDCGIECDVSPAAWVEDNWRDSIPFGDSGDRTVGEIFKNES